jgi:serine phosphatase RsbU (regulator of sigma subunit)
LQHDQERRQQEGVTGHFEEEGREGERRRKEEKRREEGRRKREKEREREEREREERRRRERERETYPPKPSRRARRRPSGGHLARSAAESFG